MRFKVDENLPVEVADLLRKAGYDATTVHEERIGGATDTRLVAICQDEQRILVTLDIDFADIRTYPPDKFPGFVVLRIKDQNKAHILRLVLQVLGMMKKEKLENQLWIVEENRVRIRS